MLKIFMITSCIALLYSVDTTAQVNFAPTNKNLENAKKSNHELLKESQPKQDKGEQDLSKKYQEQTVSPKKGTTTFHFDNTNATGGNRKQSYQHNFGNGSKATSTTQTDMSGKIKSTSTTIDWGKKKRD